MAEWDKEVTESVTRKNAAGSRNPWIRCRGCGFTKTRKAFLRRHSPSVCMTRRSLAAAGLPITDDCNRVSPDWVRGSEEDIGAHHRICQSLAGSLTEALPMPEPALPGSFASIALPEEARGLMERLLDDDNLSKIVFAPMFGSPHNRMQGPVQIFRGDTLDADATDELCAVLARAVQDMPNKFWRDRGQLRAYGFTLLRVLGDGDKTVAIMYDQAVHKDCHAAIYCCYGEVHSAFVNLKGTRHIGQVGGRPDLIIPTETLCVMHGRLGHHGKGRTLTEGTHTILHFFVMCDSGWHSKYQLNPAQDTFVFDGQPELLTQRQGGWVAESALDWPHPDRFDCAVCKTALAPTFVCSKCDKTFCFVCDANATGMCDRCRPKRRKA